jgi:hypothetical protein
VDDGGDLVFSGGVGPGADDPADQESQGKDDRLFESHVMMLRLVELLFRLAWNPIFLSVGPFAAGGVVVAGPVPLIDPPLR